MPESWNLRVKSTFRGHLAAASTQGSVELCWHTSTDGTLLPSTGILGSVIPSGLPVASTNRFKLPLPPVATHGLCPVAALQMVNPKLTLFQAKWSLLLRLFSQSLLRGPSLVEAFHWTESPTYGLGKDSEVQNITLLLPDTIGLTACHLFNI